MKRLIHYDPTEAGALHCDACHYDLPYKQAFTRELVGMPCPICGANMLTYEDYKKTATMLKVVDWLNKWFSWLGSERDDPRNKGVSMKIHDDEVIIKRK